MLLHDRYAFILRLSLSKAFFESQSQDSSRRKYSAAAPLIPISEQGVVLLWAVYTRRNSAFCAIFWHFLVQNLRRIVLKIPVKWKIFWTIFLCFLCIYVFCTKFGTEKAQNLHRISDIKIFWFLCTELAQKMYKIGTEFLTCTRFCFQKSKLFGKILDQKIDRKVSEKAQKTIILSSVNSPLLLQYTQQDFSLT